MTTRDVSRSRYGWTVYQLMLVMACVALAIAATFPILDYFQQYRGPIEKGPSVAATRPAVTSTTNAATPEETTSTTLGETAPAPETPAATETPEAPTAPAAPAPEGGGA